jgi:hypothetical protein
MDGGYGRPLGMSKKKKGPTPKKTRIRLAVISESEASSRSVIEYGGEGTPIPFIGGDAKPNLIMECGACGVALIKGVAVSQLTGQVVLKCPTCGAYNETLN